MHPHRDRAPAFLAPLIETVSGYYTAASIDERLEGRQLHQGFCTGIDHPIADRRICGPMRNQTPMHESALVPAPVSDNHGNRRRSLFRGNVKAGRVLWQVAVQVPANPNITELECSGEAATHSSGKSSVAFVEGQDGSMRTQIRCDRLLETC